MKKFDVVVIGGGPGGYVAAIRASQLGKKVAVIEKDKLGGVCLNRGCIPTKALLKAAHSVHELSEMKELGIDVELKSLNGATAVLRANKIADQVGKGVSFLMKKNNIEVIEGNAVLESKTTVKINNTELVEADKIIVATGAHYKSFPGLKHDGERLIGAWEALKMETLPKSIGIVGAGAIGVEFAYFWNAFGVDVHIFEIQPHLLPNEDEDSSVEVERAYKKLKMKLSLGVEKIEAENKGDHAVIKTIEKGAPKEYQFEKVLIAVGMTGNVDGIGLDKVGIEVERGFIKVNSNYQSSVPNIYAIGDVCGGALLAHAASHEGMTAAEHIGGLEVHPIEIKNIGGCTYCYPQVASVGYTEKQLKEKGIEYTVGKLPFRANGKAIASNEKDGFVKILLGKHGELLGGHIVGTVATELIHELAVFKSTELVAEDIINTIHPHPTLGEWISEAVLAAKGRGINS